MEIARLQFHGTRARLVGPVFYVWCINFEKIAEPSGPQALKTLGPWPKSRDLGPRAPGYFHLCIFRESVGENLSLKHVN